MNTHIYELVETSFPEDGYHTLGTFSGPQEACDAVAHGNLPEAAMEHIPDSNLVILELRRRPLNRLTPLETGEVVLTWKWTNEYNEEEDEYFWKADAQNPPSPKPSELQANP
jgi:hypothetical protein